MLDNLDELRTFQRIAMEGSLSRAARSLGLSVNAVSRRLAQLEQRLGLRLAERTTRTLNLTDEGERLAERCRRILREIDAAEAELDPNVRGLRGTVRVALHPEAVQPGLLARLGSLLGEHPALRVQIFARNTPSDPVREGLDLVLWPGEVQLQSVVAKLVARVPWVLACAPSYAERCGIPDTARELEQHLCLRALRDRPERSWTLRHRSGQVAETPVGGGFEADDNEVLRRALYGGIGIGLRPRGEVLAEAAAGRLIHVLPEYRFESIPIHLVSPRGRTRLARVRQVAAILEEAVLAMA